MMIQTYKNIADLSSTYKVEIKKVGATSYLIFPTVMMVQGVHSGSHGPVLHLTEELEKSVTAWKDTPVVIGHPQIAGNYVSAKGPEQVDEIIGTIKNPFVKDNKLHASIWVDENKISKKSPQTLTQLMQAVPMDVSVGVFTDDDKTSGEYDGEVYAAIAKNYRPDHLALLPGDVGACSWEKGCGIRVNNSNNEGNTMDQTTLIDQIKLVSSEGFSIHLMTNALSMSDVMSGIRRILDSKSTKQTSYYLVDAYDSTFVYEEYASGTDAISSIAKLWKQAYGKNATGNIELVGDPIEVTRQVEYIPLSKVNTNSLKIEKMEKKPCVIAKVEELITNAATNFGADDRDWLLGQSLEQLEKMTPKVSTGSPEVPQINKQQALEMLKDSIKTPEDFLSIMPSEVRDQYQHGLRLHAAQRSQMIADIQTNAKDVWTNDELAALNTPMLEKVYKGLKRDVDYSINVNAGIQPNTSEAPLLPPGVV